jgi:hypothetical protein
MPWLPSSPRRRRRLGWAACAAGGVLVVVAAIVLLPKAERGPENAVGTGAETGAALGPPIALTPARRREIDRLVHRFTDTAVTRQDPAAAWALASATMRTGVTRAAWNRGELPGVLPFPADAVEAVSWKVVYRTPERIGLDVLVVARPDAGRPTLVYQSDLVLEEGRLLVDAWSPQATLTGGGGSATEATPAVQETVESPYSRGRLDARWLLIPAGIVGVLLAVAALLVGRHALRSRRAYKRYRKHAGA